MNELTPEQKAKLGKDWMARLDAQKEAERTWIDSAHEAQKAYMADDLDGEPPQFNILHSNVETIVPATYNSTPSPDIRPRHNSNDKISKVVADIYERAIATQIDDERLDTEIEATALDGFLAGRGITRLKYDGEMQDDILIGERVLSKTSRGRITARVRRSVGLKCRGWRSAITSDRRNLTGDTGMTRLMMWARIVRTRLTTRKAA